MEFQYIHVFENYISFFNNLSKDYLQVIPSSLSKKLLQKVRSMGEEKRLEEIGRLLDRWATSFAKNMSSGEQIARFHLPCKVVGLHHKHPCNLELHHRDTEAEKGIMCVNMKSYHLDGDAETFLWTPKRLKYWAITCNIFIGPNAQSMDALENAIT